MSANLLSYAGWTFLPNLVSGWVQWLYYGITIRAGDPKPQPGTPRYIKHRRRIHMTVVIVYLLYTIYEADYWVRQQSDFYQDLGLPQHADEKKIKSRFRRLAAIHHPDKVSVEDSYTAGNYFVNLKVAQDTLIDPAKRFAYERFGPDMLRWQHCSSIRDYLMVGLQATIPLYAGSIIFLVMLGVLGYLQNGRFWRYLTVFSLFLLEYHSLTRPYQSPLLSKLINPLLSLSKHPPLLPFQLLILARKVAFTLFIAGSQLGAFFHTDTPPTGSASGVPTVLESQQLTRLEQLAQSSEVEASRLLALDMAPFVGDEAGLKELRGKMKDWLVTNTIRSDIEVRDAMNRVIAKRTAGAPLGTSEDS